MKKLLAILLIAFFAVGFSSCAEESFDTEPVIPEINTEALQDNKSSVDMRKRRKRDRGQLSTSRG